MALTERLSVRIDVRELRDPFPSTCILRMQLCELEIKSCIRRSSEVKTEKQRLIYSNMQVVSIEYHSTPLSLYI